MKRVAIVGPPGAGKSTFSRKLVSKTGLPLVHLDLYYHEPEHDYEHNRDAWIMKVIAMIKEDKWIMDGNYRSSFPTRFERADTIFFLDFPRWLVLYRVFKRRFEYRNKKRTDMPDAWREKIDPEFLQFVWRFNKQYRPEITALLATNHDKEVIIFHKPEDITKYLNGL